MAANGLCLCACMRECVFFDTHSLASKRPINALQSDALPTELSRLERCELTMSDCQDSMGFGSPGGVSHFHTQHSTETAVAHCATILWGRIKYNCQKYHLVAW